MRLRPAELKKQISDFSMAVPRSNRPGFRSKGEFTMWLLAAVLSAVFGGLTSILAKCGIKNTDSDVATALRTAVVLLFSWIMVFVSGSAESLTDVDSVSLLFLILSGFATGASWLCYFKALSAGDINKVVPIDKSSTVLSVLLAILLFGETGHLPAKLLGALLLAVGIFLMIEPKQNAVSRESRKACVYAAFSAVFASLTSILAKIGINGVDSTLGTAIRTCVVLLMAWLVVLLKKKQAGLKKISRKELSFIALSGLATGASWLCYYYALQNGIVSVVVPVDKLSIAVTIIFSFLIFHERLSRKAFAGLCAMIGGTILLAILA